ncbi:MAG: hypothetical protein ABH811_03070 [archaeon]
MKKKLTIFLLIMSLAMFLLVLYVNSKIVLKEEEIIATLIVGKKSGFDANTTALTFGMIAPGSSSSRSLVIENGYDFPIKVEFSAKGNIADFLIFEKIIYLDPRETSKLSIGTIIITNENPGNYSGKMIVITKRNLFGNKE